MDGKKKYLSVNIDPSPQIITTNDTIEDHGKDSDQSA